MRMCVFIVAVAAAQPIELPPYSCSRTQQTLLQPASRPSTGDIRKIDEPPCALRQRAREHDGWAQEGAVNRAGNLLRRDGAL